MRLATALLLFAGGIVAAGHTNDFPAVTPSAVTPGKGRADAVGTVSRSRRRLPLPHVNPPHFPGKARRHPQPAPTGSGTSHDLRGAGQPHDWDAVAACESSGDWTANTGNGFYGGLQFTLSTWRAFGGRGWPNLASRLEQIRVAELVLAGQGAGAWPVCGRYL